MPQAPPPPAHTPQQAPAARSGPPAQDLTAPQSHCYCCYCCSWLQQLRRLHQHSLPGPASGEAGSSVPEAHACARVLRSESTLRDMKQTKRHVVA